MIVCIAEKPSVARDIADVLGAKDKKDGYIEGNGYQVTWTFGHLCTLRNRTNTPPTGSRGAWAACLWFRPFRHQTHQQPYLRTPVPVIENLMQHADMIINCGDAGQERD